MCASGVKKCGVCDKHDFMTDVAILDSKLTI